MVSLLITIFSKQSIALQKVTGLGHGDPGEAKYTVVQEGDEFPDSLGHVGDRLLTMNFPLNKQSENDYQKGDENAIANHQEFDTKLVQSIDNLGGDVELFDEIFDLLQLAPENPHYRGPT